MNVESPAASRALAQWRHDCKVLAAQPVDLPADADDAEARLRALPPGASMVYWRGALDERRLGLPSDMPEDPDSDEARAIRARAAGLRARLSKLAADGRCLLVQRRVGPVEAGTRDYIAVRVSR